MSGAGMVGAFPGMDWKRRAIRAPVNEFDKSTVVSICPKELNDRKPTIQPGHFILGPGSLEHPSVLVVGPSSWWRDVDVDQPLLEIPVSSIQIAESVVRYWCNGIIASNMSDTMPGYFYVPGEFTSESIKKEKAHLLKAAQEKQHRWFTLLVKMADSLWARSNGNPLAISDDMRLAARELNLHETK